MSISSRLSGCRQWPLAAGASDAPACGLRTAPSPGAAATARPGLLPLPNTDLKNAGAQSSLFSSSGGRRTVYTCGTVGGPHGGRCSQCQHTAVSTSGTGASRSPPDGAARRTHWHLFPAGHPGLHTYGTGRLTPCQLPAGVWGLRHRPPPPTIALSIH